jgi:transcriptional regulator GlxA family with amidase domain
MGSVCSGAMLLAEAGLLDGKRVTTHWGRVQEMRQRYPAVRIEDDRLWIRHGRYWTSAGISAGIDLALAIVTEDLGPSVAKRVACPLVVAAQRPGGQTQHSRLHDLTPPGSRFAELNAWMSQRLDQPLAVEDLAAHIKMSPRTFSRGRPASAQRRPWSACGQRRRER